MSVRINTSFISVSETCVECDPLDIQMKPLLKILLENTPVIHHKRIVLIFINAYTNPLPQQPNNQEKSKFIINTWNKIEDLAN